MSGATANVTLPSNIAPGNYIMRHEIIALHLANEKGGAEFYPSCSQLNITGSGTGAPTASELVSFPGAYSDTDPGIYVPAVRRFHFILRIGMTAYFRSLMVDLRRPHLELRLPRTCYSSLRVRQHRRHLCRPGPQQHVYHLGTQ